jgi:AraC-like DNA-binding protein
VIKDDLRRDMAIDLLCNTTRSVDDIGFALGFSEHSAFYRAFRRWTGASPGSIGARLPVLRGRGRRAQ